MEIVYTRLIIIHIVQLMKLTSYTAIHKLNSSFYFINKLV